jgi:23S rRNA (cytidine1920-2'-O)/16S rRNA (cytidine1409-2'-O)-methyltransferase
MVAGDAAIAVADPAGEYVSRSALKLVAGLDAAAFDVDGCNALDVGASTGGFTQVLLQRGAARVVALDVGSDQLAKALREDARVTVMEGSNARDIGQGDLPYAPDFIAVDVSFISLTLVLPAVLALAASDACGVFLFKPQFEVGRDGLGRGGIVRENADVEGAFAAVVAVIETAGWRVVASCDAPIAGGDGNRERLIAACVSTAPAR